MKNFLHIFILPLLLAVPSASLAEQYEYKDYVVKKGDTLWDISKAEIKDNYKWPLIWRENLRINNPDRIYPGQVLRIPVRVIPQAERLIVKEKMPPEEAPVEAPEPVVEEPAVLAEPSEPVAPAEEAGEVAVEKPVEEPVEKPAVKKPINLGQVLPLDLIESSGYISHQAPNKGVISGALSKHTIFAKGDELYIKTSGPVSKGDKFYVVRKEQKVNHPEKGGMLGYVVRVTGVVEVERVAKKTEARVIKTFDVVKVGDTLDTYYKIEIPELTELRKPDVSGFVVASTNMRAISGYYDVVYIDKGSRDGLQIADLLTTILPGTSDRPNATIQVVNVRETTGTAVVFKGSTAVRIGDAFAGIE